MPAVRREGGGQQMVADDDEGMLPIVLPVADGRPLHISIAGLTVSAEPLGNEDQDAADDRGAAPSGERPVR